MSQKCMDCNGRGYTGNPNIYCGATVCPTCESKGGIYRTGPYWRLNGTWSDGVRRISRVNRYQFALDNPNRVRVYRDFYRPNLWYVSTLDLSRPYDSFERAQEAALQLARTGML